MKNRLEIARELLRDDGVIFVQCDDNEQAYLKVLMDEIFGARRSKDDSQNNFVGCVVVKMSESSGVKMSHTDARFAKLKEFILVYKKNKIRLNASKVSKENLDKFSSYAKYYSKIIENIDDSTEDWKIYPLNDYLVKNNLKLNDDEILDFKLKNAHRMVYRTNNKSFKNLNIRKPIAEIVSSRGKKYIWWEGKQMLFLEDYLLETIGDLWTDISSINLNKEGDCDFKNAKKPEKLLHRIIDMTTNEGDLVLDFFAGSGTTLAVAHKMGRRWIGIEQMDYVESITKERLKKVIEGEQGGVSKAVEWNGGGEFVYAEMMGLNLAFREKITQAKESDMEGIYSEIKEWAFLDYRTDGKIEKWEELTLEERKAALMGLLDSNMDYLPYSEIRDKSFCVSEVDIELNGVVYGEKK